jgi:hypothetical protein
MEEVRRTESVAKLEVELELAGFAGAVAQVEAEQRSLTREELISLAVEYYLAESGGSRPSLRVPAWLDELGDGDVVPLSLELRLETWEQLVEAARSARTSVEHVLEHATLTLIADLDAGRVAARVASA